MTELGSVGGVVAEQTQESLVSQLLARLEEMTHPSIGHAAADRATLDRGWRLLRRLVEQPDIARGAAERFLAQHAAVPLQRSTPMATDEIIQVDVDSDSMDDFFDSISSKPIKVVRTDGATTNYPWEKKG